MTDDFSTIIPALQEWNNGAGIDPKSWIECVGNYELATGYSLVFWPKFVCFSGYVFREGFRESSVAGFEKATGGNRIAVESVMNHLHIADIHCNVEPNAGQLRYIGRTLREIWETKLSRDFPGLRFVVSFNDEPDLDLTDYELTFWQEP